MLAAELRGTPVTSRDLAAALQLELAAMVPSRHRPFLLPVAVNLQPRPGEVDSVRGPVEWAHPTLYATPCEKAANIYGPQRDQ